MLSITGEDFSYWIAPESMVKRFCDLLGFTDLGRQTYFYSAVDLKRDSVQRLDNIIRALMARGDDDLVTSYSSVGPDRQLARSEFLEEVLGSNQVEDTLHDLRFRFSKGKCRVHLILSRRKVQLRFIGGVEHEHLKRSLKKSVAGIIKKSKARFLKYLLFLTIFMFAAFNLMWAADLWGARFSTRFLLNIVALLSTIVLLPLIIAHNQGVYLPHTTITLAKSQKAQRALDIASLINLLGIIVDIVTITIELLQRTRRELSSSLMLSAQAKIR